MEDISTHSTHAHVHVHQHEHDDSHHMCKIGQMKDQRKVMEEYDKWAESYDQHLDSSNHNKHLVVEEVVRLVGDSRDLRVLDVACATGIGGQLMKKAGFQNIDGLDSSQKMLDLAKSKDVYQNYVCCGVGNDYNMPIDDETYDVIIIIGGVGRNHMEEESFEILSRILKPGGVLVSASSVNFVKDPNFEATMKKNHDEGILMWLSTKRVQGYLKDLEGLIYSFQKPQ